MRIERCGLVIALVVCFVGCSGEGHIARPAVVPTSGSVKYKGAAVAEASVLFTSEESGRTAFGQTNAEGEFKLTTFDSNDGAVPGSHIVTISKQSASAATMTPEDLSKERKPMELSKNQLPPKYADPKKSGLKRTVVKGESNVFNFDLQD